MRTTLVATCVAAAVLVSGCKALAVVGAIGNGMNQDGQQASSYEGDRSARNTRSLTWVGGQEFVITAKGNQAVRCEYMRLDGQPNIWLSFKGTNCPRTYKIEDY